MYSKLLEFAENRYPQFKAPEFDGNIPYSEQFFTDWRESGFFSAFNGLKHFLEKYGIENSTTYAIKVLAGSALLSTGLTAFAQKAKATLIEDRTPEQLLGLGLYNFALSFMTDPRVNENYDNLDTETTVSKTGGPWGTTTTHTEISPHRPDSFFDQK